MIQTTFDPLRLQVDGLEAYNNRYIDYILSLGFHSADVTTVNVWVKIYKGKSLVLGGKTDIDLSSVINDYRYRPEINNGIPANTITIGESLTVGELKFQSILNTKIKVEFYFNGAEIKDEVQIDVCSYKNNILESPYVKEDATVLSKAYNTSNIVNHYPFIKTDNMWLSLDFAQYQKYGSVVGSGLCFKTNRRYDFNTNSYGNYSVSVSLKDLYNSITTASSRVLDGDKINLLYSVDGSYTLSDAVGVVDLCPSDYYMMWHDSKGFHTVSVGRVDKIYNSDQRQIKNVYNERLNVWNDIDNVYHIKTNKLNSVEFDDYAGLLEAPWVMLYDVKNDKSIVCNLSTSSFDMTKKTGAKYIEFDLIDRYIKRY